jgi:hypothetical protein
MPHLQKNCNDYLCYPQQFWFKLGWKDSNLRMAVPKTAALPLGDTPITFAKWQYYYPAIFFASDLHNLFKERKGQKEFFSFFVNVPEPEPVPEFFFVNGHVHEKRRKNAGTLIALHN